MWRLDRVGRNLRHLVLLLEDLQAIGVGFVSLKRASTSARQQVVSNSTSSRLSASSSGAGFRIASPHEVALPSPSEDNTEGNGHGHGR